MFTIFVHNGNVPSLPVSSLFVVGKLCYQMDITKRLSGWTQLICEYPIHFQVHKILVAAVYAINLPTDHNGLWLSNVVLGFRDTKLQKFAILVVENQYFSNSLILV